MDTTLSAPALLYRFWCVLQCVAVCCSVLQCVAVCRSVSQCVAVCCSVWQCVTVCCSVLQWRDKSGYTTCLELYRHDSFIFTLIHMFTMCDITHSSVQYAWCVCSVYVCACVYACVYVRACVCVCVRVWDLQSERPQEWKGETGRGGGERQRRSEGDRGWEKDRIRARKRKVWVF